MGKKKKAAPPRPLTRKQQSRAEREARMNRWIIAGVAAVVVVAVAVLIYGFLAEVVFEAREPVAVVFGEPISTADFVANVRYRRYGLNVDLNVYRAQRMELDPTDPQVTVLLEQLDEEIRRLETQLSSGYATLLGQQVLSEMAQGELVRQEAARRGMTVSQEEVDRAIEEYFGYYQETGTEGPELPVAGPVTTTQAITPTGSVTREQFEQRYRDHVEFLLEPSGLGEEGFRDLMEVGLLYEKIREAISEAVPTTLDQLETRLISFPSEEEAAEVVERLDAGEAWEDIVGEIEADESGSAYASRASWKTETFITQQFGEENSGVVLQTEVGAYTQPLAGTDGPYYVVQVLGREERELESLMLYFEQNRVFEEWMSLQFQAVVYSENWQEKVPTEP